MLRATYIGDEITASGFALVGVSCRITPNETRAVWKAVRKARKHSDLVILDQAHADVVQARLQELISAHPIPPIVVVPSMSHSEAADDTVVGPARRTLGLG